MNTSSTTTGFSSLLTATEQLLESRARPAGLVFPELPWALKCASSDSVDRNVVELPRIREAIGAAD